MYFTKTVALLSCVLAASAISTPHIARDLHHRSHALGARNAAAAPEAPSVAPVVVPRKRALNRCRASNSTTVAVSSSSAAPVTTEVSSSSVESEPTAAPVNVGGNLPVFSSSADPAPSSSSKPAIQKPVSTSAAPVDPPATTKATTSHTPAKPTTTQDAAPAATSPSSGSGSSGGSFVDGTHSGDATFYGTGLGACGIVNKDTDFIAAVSHLLFDSFPGYNGANPNNNPICNKKATAHYQGKSVTVALTDRCVGCAEWDLDFSPAAFDQLADEALGRLHGMTWSFD